MVVYRWLPQINCQQCGEPTCYSFAIKLVASQQEWRLVRHYSNCRMRKNSQRCKI